MKVKIQYIGRRMNGSKVNHCFRWRKKQLYWTGIRFLIIGEWYFADQSKDGLRMSRIPESTEGPELSTVERVSFEAQELIVRQYIARRGAESKAKRSMGILREIAPLKKYFKGLSWIEKKMLIEFLLDHV